MIKKLILVLSLFWESCISAQDRDSTVSLLMQAPDKEFEAIKCNKSWENNLHYATILNVGDKYVMYYRSYSKKIPNRLIYCYAQSKDGIHWTKPNLGKYEFDGKTSNNIISDKFNGASVEYKDGIYFLLADRIYDEDGNEKRGLYLFESRNGIVFDQKGNPAPMHCDTQNQLMWNKWTHSYWWYLRSWSPPVIPKFHPHHERVRFRNVSLFKTTTPDISKLSVNYLSKTVLGSKITTLKNEFPVIMRNVKRGDYDIYTPCVHQYHKDLYIAYPTYYYHIADKAHGGKKDNDGYGKIAMWVSNDGEHFQEIASDYMTNGENWLEFCIGHIETDEYFIHYYITFDNSHAGPARKNSIRGRIHYKKR